MAQSDLSFKTWVRDFIVAVDGCETIITYLPVIIGIVKWAILWIVKIRERPPQIVHVDATTAMCARAWHLCHVEAVDPILGCFVRTWDISKP